MAATQWMRSSEVSANGRERRRWTSSHRRSMSVHTFASTPIARSPGREDRHVSIIYDCGFHDLHSILSCETNAKAGREALTRTLRHPFRCLSSGLGGSSLVLRSGFLLSFGFRLSFWHPTASWGLFQSPKR